MLVTNVYKSHLKFSKHYNIQFLLCGALNDIGNYFGAAVELSSPLFTAGVLCEICIKSLIDTLKF